MQSDVEEDRAVAQRLRGAGLQVKSVYDLVNSSASYAQAVPILLELLQSVKHPNVLEGVVRALSVKEAKGVAAPTLIALFERMKPQTQREVMLKWAVGNALSVVADDTVFEDIKRLAADKSHGWSRSMLAAALGQMQRRRPEAIELLRKLLADHDLGVQAMITLGDLRVVDAAPQIESFLQNDDSWVRQQAKRALAKLETARKKSSRRSR